MKPPRNWPRMLKAKAWTNERVGFAQHKIDGHRILIRKRAGKIVHAYTTVGHEIGTNFIHCDWWKRIVTNVPEHTDIEGEVYVSGKPASHVKTAIKTAPKTLQFVAFATNALPDMADLFEVNRLFVKWGLPKAVTLRLTDSFSREILLKRAKEDKVEGWMLKAGNYADWYKLKAVRTIDVIVTAIVPGKGKYINQAGALKVSTFEGKEVANVSGMNDAVRASIDHNTIGAICEVAYQCVGSKGRLRHPRFIRWRDDKLASGCTLDQDPDLAAVWGDMAAS